METPAATTKIFHPPAQLPSRQRLLWVIPVLALVVFLLIFLGLSLGVYFSGPTILITDYIDQPTTGSFPVTDPTIPPTQFTDSNGATRFLLHAAPTTTLRNLGGLSIAFHLGTLIPFYIPIDHSIQCLMGINTTTRLAARSGHRQENSPSTPLSSPDHPPHPERVVSRCPYSEAHDACAASSPLLLSSSLLHRTSHTPPLLMRDDQSIQQMAQRKQRATGVAVDVRAGTRPSRRYSASQEVRQQLYALYPNTAFADFPLYYWMISGTSEQAYANAIDLRGYQTVHTTILLTINTTVSSGSNFLAQVDQDCRSYGYLHAGVMFKAPYSRILGGMIPLKFTNTLVMETQFRIQCDQLVLG